MSRIMLKPFLEASDMAVHKPASPVTEACQKLEISDIKPKDMILSMQLKTKVLIKLCRCAG